MPIVEDARHTNTLRTLSSGKSGNREILNSLPTECHLLITFANSLDPDQA